jgi:hypothetical protein
VPDFGGDVALRLRRGCGAAAPGTRPG